MNTKRYRSCILAACCVPWNEDLTFAEEIFRRQVRHLISHGMHDLDIFGTAGEAYEVTDRQFDEITQVFPDNRTVDTRRIGSAQGCRNDRRVRPAHLRGEHQPLAVRLTKVSGKGRCRQDEKEIPSSLIW